MKMLLNLLGFTNNLEDLGCYELEEEILKKENREKIQAIRKVVHAEVLETGHSQSSTLMNQLAKRLMRLTLGALLLGGGEALGHSSPMCLVSSKAPTTSWTVSMLVTINFVLMLVIILVLKSAYNMHKRIQETQETMKWIRRQIDRRADRRAIRAEEQTRLGVYLESGDGESEEESSQAEDRMVNGEAHVRMVRLEEDEGEEEEPEMEEIEAEPERAEVHGDRAVEMDGAVADDGYDYDYEDPMDDEETEGSDFETDYGSLCIVDEKDSDFEGLDEETYDEYRFQLLSEATWGGAEHYILRKLAELRKMTMSEEIWYEIRNLMNMHKAVQLGSATSRRDVIDYLKNRRRYDSHVRAGRILPGERLEESDMPEAWIAARYGWNQFRTQQSQERDDEEVSWLGEGDETAAAAAEEAEEGKPAAASVGDPISTVVDAVAADLAAAFDEMADDGRGSASDRPRTDPKAKAGGKGRNGQSGTEPPHEDEADDHA